MKLLGIIAEYNPFHNGHAYQIKEAKTTYGADYVIVLMSRHFVQRGEPAFFDATLRAKSAITAGADAVFALPIYDSTASSELFARGAVNILSSLGCDMLLYGAETPSSDTLKKIATLLLNEPQEYQIALQTNLKEGLSYKTAMTTAISSLFPDVSPSTFSPNNTLGIEYEKAIQFLSSPMKGIPMKRKGSTYTEHNLTLPYPSASSVRAYYKKEQSASLPALEKALPSAMYKGIQNHWHILGPVVLDDFSLLLKAKLLQNDVKDLTTYTDVSYDLARRIYHQLDFFSSYSQFVSLLQTRSFPALRIQRSLLHILLDITITGQEKWDFLRQKTGVQLLGVKKESLPLLKEIKKRTTIPFFTKPTQWISHLASYNLDKTELYSLQLYASTLAIKYNKPYQNPLREPFFLL